MRRIVMALLGLLSTALVLAACSPAEQELPTQITPPPFQAPRPAATTEVEGARATPEAEVEPVAQHELLEQVDQLQERTSQLATRVPESQDLILATEEATGLMRELDTAYLEMDAEQQEATLAGMADVMSGLIDMVTSEASHGQQVGLADPAAGTRGPEGKEPAMEPQVVQTPGPRVPLPDHPLIMEEIEQLRQGIRESASESPTVEDTLRALVQIREMLLTLHAQVDMMAETDATGVVHELAGSTEDLRELMRAYVREENRVAPGQGGSPSRLP